MERLHLVVCHTSRSVYTPSDTQSCFEGSCRSIDAELKGRIAIECILSPWWRLYEDSRRNCVCFDRGYYRLNSVPEGW